MKRLICIFSLCMLLSACSDPMPQSGQASHTWGDGNTYVGEWKDGKPHGKGTATYVVLGRYVGTFKKGKQHGRGEANYVDGRKYVGEWKDGDPWQGKEYDKDGKVIATYSEGVSSVVEQKVAFDWVALGEYFLAILVFLSPLFLVGVLILLVRWENKNKTIEDVSGYSDRKSVYKKLPPRSKRVVIMLDSLVKAHILFMIIGSWFLYLVISSDDLDRIITLGLLGLAVWIGGVFVIKGLLDPRAAWLDIERDWLNRDEDDELFEGLPTPIATEVDTVNEVATRNSRSIKGIFISIAVIIAILCLLGASYCHDANRGGRATCSSVFSDFF